LQALQTLQSVDPAVSRSGAQVTAAIGAYEIPKGAWPTLLPALFANVSSPATSDGTKVASLESLGYMCESFEEELEKPLVDQILSSIISGMGEACPNTIRKAAVEALNNSIKFAEANFDVEAERNAILLAICSTAKCPDVKVRELSYRGLAEIAENYYSYLGPYMEFVFPLTSEAISTDVPDVAKMAVDFWSVIFENEMELGDSEENLHFANKAKDPLMPLIFSSCLKKSEDDDDDEWTLSDSADLCLQNMVEAVGSDMIPPIVAFTSQNIEGPWQNKRAALFAMSTIMSLECEQLKQYVLPVIPYMLKYLQEEPQSAVREHSANSLGEILRYHTALLPSEGLQQILGALHSSVDDPSVVVSKDAIRGLMCFAQYILENTSTPDEQVSNPLSAYAQVLLMKLLLTAEKPGFEARIEAYEAASIVIEACARDQYALILQVLSEANSRLERTFTAALADGDRSSSQSDICGVINVCVRKLPAEQFVSVADNTMMLLLRVLTSTTAAAKEEALMTVGFVADSTGENFERYFQAFFEYILAGLSNIEETSNCLQAVMALTAIVKAMGPKLIVNNAAGLDAWMGQLLNILGADAADR